MLAVHATYFGRADIDGACIVSFGPWWISGCHSCIVEEGVDMVSRSVVICFVALFEGGTRSDWYSDLEYVPGPICGGVILLGSAVRTECWTGGSEVWLVVRGFCDVCVW